MKQQLAMVIDSTKCIDCKGCVVACKVENKVSPGHSRNWIKVDQPDFSDPNWMTKSPSSHFQPGGCMHCSRPTCVDACPSGATFKNKTDGTIQVDNDLCIGCGICLPACPYNARHLHPHTQVADKCDFCADRRTHKKQPSCVETCPTKARVFGDLKDETSEAAILFNHNKTVQVLSQNVNTHPNMYYLNDTTPKNWPKDVSFSRPVRLWKNAANPFVWAATGVNSLVVLAMLGRQLIERKNKVSEQIKQQREE